MKWLLSITSIFLVQAAASWAYLFWLILRHGEVLVYESNKAWLTAEFGTAIGLVILGGIGLFFGFKSLAVDEPTNHPT